MRVEAPRRGAGRPVMTMHRTLLACATALGLLFSSETRAEPSAPPIFCERYPTSATCLGGPASCDTCHDSTEPVDWNPYGEAVRKALGGPLSPSEFTLRLDLALGAIETADADGDGVSNRDEIQEGSLPGDPTSVPFEAVCPEDTTGMDYPICERSPRHILRKIHLDVCGRSPRWVEMEAFLEQSPEAQEAALHEALDVCLDSEHWLGKDGVLWQLAHPKVRPVAALKGSAVEVGPVPLANYDHDYQLYVWSQIDDHDARSVLTADFGVLRDDGPTRYYAATDTELEQECAFCLEPMQVERRVGNITSRWFLSYFVMFTPLPRAAASQAYRAYLGYDIARNEGLFPITVDQGFPVTEPADHDRSGVDAPGCATCHSTLDPLSYAFRNYTGLVSAPGYGRTQYIPDRLEQLWPDDTALHATPESGYLLAESYDNLVEWGQIAANSDAFAKAAVMDYWRLLVGRPPTADEGPEYESIWRRFQGEHDYSVERMLHDLVDTEAYGAI